MHSSPLLGWLFFLLQVWQKGIPLLSDIVVCFGSVPNSLWILVESNEIHEMLFLRQSQQNQGSLLSPNVSKIFVSRREHFLWSHLLQQSQKMHSCFLPITLAHFTHLYTTKSGQEQYKFLFLVWFSNSVLLRPEHLRWCQILQQEQHILFTLAHFPFALSTHIRI